MTAPGYARFTPEDLARPPHRGRDVITTLADFALVTYAVEPRALAALLPEGVVPEVFPLADGRERALVSAVPFRDLDFRFSFAPWLTFQFGQTNYRAYVTHRGQRAVWFFGTSLATRYVAIPRYLWKLPWHRAQMQFETAWDGERCTRYQLSTQGAWGAAELVLQGTDTPQGTLDGFADEESTTVILTHPLRGLFRQRDGKLGSYSVWHDRLRLQRGEATRARFSVFEDLALITRDQVPHSVLLQRETEFLVFLPPKTLAP